MGQGLYAESLRRRGLPMKSALDRFEEKYIPEPNSGCWLWFGAVAGQDGRGNFRMGPRGNVYAYRASWEFFKGPVPDGLQVLHSCDMPCCVNPDHLWLGTQADNMKDCAKKGRIVSPLAYRSGETNLNAKINLAAVLEIRSGLSPAESMRKFGISKAHVSRIKAGTSWREK